jgi:peptide/nickel transport system substrate-binding protein
MATKAKVRELKSDSNIWAVWATTLVIIFACSTGQSTQQPAVAGGTVVVRLFGDWTHLDPQILFQSAPGGQITSAIYDRLVAAGPGGKVVPYVAKSWKATPTTLTFSLRTDVICSDGTPLTPSAIRQSFDRLLHGPAASQKWGPGPFTVSADDAAGTLTISIESGFSDAIYSAAAEPIICPAGLAKPDALKTQPLGSGPYILESAVHGDQAVARLRPEWKWGPNGITANTPGFPQKLIFKVIDNETTAANLLTTGGLDLAQINGPDVQRLLADKSLTHKVAPFYGTAWVSFNETPGHITTDENVREALMTAIDPKVWNQAANQGRGKVADAILMPDNDCYDPSLRKLLPTPSIDRAKAILQADGYTVANDGKLVKDGKPLKIRLIGTPAYGLGNGAEYIAEQWNKLGIVLDFQSGNFVTWIASLRAANFDATVYPAVGQLSNPQPLFWQFAGPPAPKGANLAQTINPEVDKEYAAALSSSGPERCQHWSGVQRALFQKHDVLPLASSPWDWFSKGIDLAPASSAVLPQFFRRTG